MPVTLREGMLATVAMLALIAVQLVAITGLYLFSKYFWVDELGTTRTEAAKPAGSR